MSGNTFGKLFTITTFGESHGPAIGVTVDGVPAGIDLPLEAIQNQLNRRKPGQSVASTPRKEDDTAQIVSGVFEGKTTGTPLTVIILNETQKSKDYSHLKDIYRPGHADYTFQKKYGIRDYRGGGRTSGRETAARVAGGAVARQFLSLKNIEITAYTLAIANIRCETYQQETIEQNPMRACDPIAAKKMEERLIKASAKGESLGGIVECRVSGLPIGLGEGVFDKLDARLAAAIFSIGAVKGFEIGAGFQAAKMEGSQNNDQMNQSGFITNNAGGVLGGLSNGNELIFRAAFKPTPSISKEQKTVTTNNKETTLSVKGRHDPIICPRAVPVVEAMTALVLADLILIDRAAQTTIQPNHF